MIKFEVLKEYKSARRGRLTTPHGIIETPVFMPVGTLGSVKSLNTDQIESTNSQIILCNTYHLYLRPGREVLDHFKGVHNFMNWYKSILTDSGGYQVMSLRNGLVKLSEEGATFKSHIDGSSHFFSPEISMQIQKSIGSDIIMALDEPIDEKSNYRYSKESINKTIRWLDRCINEWRKLDKENRQSLFGIIQGGMFEDLRIESVKQTIDRGLEGIAIGGESIGHSRENTKQVLEWVMPYIPKNVPRYPMGVGEIEDIFGIVERGADMFDCVIPTRVGRNGYVIISPEEGGNVKNKFRMDIIKSIHSMEEEPIDRTCGCYTCKTYTRGYLNHLFRAKELLAYSLASIHNLYMMSQLMNDIRGSIEDETFGKLKEEWVGN